MTQRRVAPAANAVRAGLDQYDFLASAIAGCRVTIQHAGEDGARAYSNGRAIFVPLAADDDGHDAWAPIAAQAALIGAGSLHASTLVQLVGRPALAQRYLVLEMLRASRVLADRLPLAFSTRIELQHTPVTQSARSSLEVAASRVELPEPPAYFGRIRPLFGMRAAFRERGSNSAAPGKREAGKREAAMRAAVPQLDDDDAGESSTLLRLFQNPFSTNSPLSDLLQGILGAGMSKQQGAAESGDTGGELPVGRIERALQRGVNAVLSRLPMSVPDLDAGPAAPPFVYPEWDVHTHAYRRDWVSIEETEAWREDGPVAVDALTRGAALALQRQLSGLGVDPEMHRRQRDGSDLDPGALIECAIELRTGDAPPAPQVYRTSRRTRRDLAIAVVIDISASTGEQPSDGESTFTKQLQIAHELGRVLTALGDRVAMFAFHSWGRQLMRVVRVKGHAERWGVQVADRMALLEPSGYTRIGAAIRHGTHVLSHEMRLPNRLMVLVTDGIAYDQDYELSYAAADAQRALAEARTAGTACVCLSVGSGTDIEKLTEVFGANNLLAVDEVEQVTARIRAVCRHALASVSQRRRVLAQG